jgi:hypothetical protein
MYIIFAAQLYTTTILLVAHFLYIRDVLDPAKLQHIVYDKG